MLVRAINQCLIGVFKSAQVMSTCRIHSQAQSQALNRLLHRGCIARCFPQSTVQTETANKTVHISPCVSDLPPVIYAGFDPSGPSLHLGHCALINTLLQLAAVGYKVIFLVGSSTAQLGDPSGRDSDRPGQDAQVIVQNGRLIRAQIERIVHNFEQHILPGMEGADQEVVRERGLQYALEDNSTWYEHMNVVDFLRRVGPGMRVGSMLKRKNIRQRLDQGGLPLHEFVYQSLQCYDWLHLQKEHDCYMQLGGSDQLGHLEAGYHFLTKHLCADNQLRPVGFMTDLVTHADGRKIAEHMRAPGKWLAQSSLADAVTLLVHGACVLQQVQSVSRFLFACRMKPAKLAQLEPAQIELASRVLPKIQLSRTPAQTRTVCDLLVMFGANQTVDSAKTDIASGALHVNEIKCTDIMLCPQHEQFVLAQSHYTLIRMGKRSFALIEWI